MSDWFERRVEAALRAEVSLGRDERARRRVMERVRGAAAEGHPLRRNADPWHRLTRHSLVGVSLAAGIGGITTLSALVPAARRDAAGFAPMVIGDTVVATLHDTLRLVRLMFDAPEARRVAVAGDFNRWDADATPLARDPRTRHWTVTLALRDGEHRYAFVVDGTRWMPDPRSAHATRGDDGRVYSLLSLGRVAN